MNVGKITEENAFDAGAELWVITPEQNKWWQEIDYRSGFLLATCLQHQKTEPSVKIEEILKETQLETQLSRINSQSQKKSLLVATENHFMNKWIFVIPDDSSASLDEVAQACESLKVHSVRFFSTPPSVVQAFSTRLSTSLNRISFVE